MSDFLKPSDFATGNILLSQSDKTEIDLQIVIDKIEVDVLRRLFGIELYDLFIADLTVPFPRIPQAARFIVVFNEIYLDDPIPFISEGILEMLKWFIWAEFVREQPFQNTTVGTVRNEAENAKIVTGSEYGWEVKYNKAVHSYINIQRFMLDDATLYPEFNGRHKRLASIV